MLPPSPPETVRVFPIQLQIGDWLSDETGEWEVVGRPQTSSYEKVTVIRRATGEEGE